MKPNYMTILPEETSLGALHSYMLAAVGPRPIAFVSTIDSLGRPNLAPFSFFNAFGTNPATLVFSPARRGKDNSTKHTLHNVEAIPECVINVVTYHMVEQVSLASTDFEEGVSEFEKAGFTPLPSRLVRPFRVAESPACFECRVEEIIRTGDQGGAGNLVVCRILAIHYREDVVKPDNTIDVIAMDLVGRMGYEFYCRANADSIFEVPKPRTRGVLGFDGLPDFIRESHELTGNELARLASLKRIPEEAEIRAFLEENQSQAVPVSRLLDQARENLQRMEAEKALTMLMALHYAKKTT
jgi:flavin reductase (DIM6/NTAB) family NADH-FMN oxidoreductase RutF